MNLLGPTGSAIGTPLNPVTVSFVGPSGAVVSVSAAHPLPITGTATGAQGATGPTGPSPGSTGPTGPTGPGTTGFSGTITTASLVGKTITVVNGVITSFA